MHSEWIGCSGPGCSQQEQAISGEGRPGGPAGRAEAGQQRPPERPACAQLTQHCTQHGTAASSIPPGAPSYAAPPRSCRSQSPASHGTHHLSGHSLAKCNDTCMCESYNLHLPGVAQLLQPACQTCFTNAAQSDASIAKLTAMHASKSGQQEGLGG